MSETIGPDLLGRRYEPDPRDWKMASLLALDYPTNDLLSKTVQQVMDDGTYFSSWQGILVFWRWAKQVHGGTPTPPPVVEKSKLWEDPIQLDQGQTNHCVGFGWAGWGDAAPVEDRFQNADAHAIYYEAKVIDGQPRQENGSTVRSGAKAMVNRRRLGAYVFAEKVEEVEQWVLGHGPVVVGTDWTQDMFSPDKDGFIRPTGRIAGGHCYLMIGYDETADVFTFDNSWGPAWGLEGRFKMHASDFADLLASQGEACAGLELPLA